MSKIKKCYKCKKEKTLDSFSKNKIRKDGLQSECRSCKAVTSRKYYNKKRKKSPYKKVDFPPDDSEFWDYPLYIRGKEVSKEEYKRHMTNNPGDWDLDKKANVEGGAEKSDNLEAWYDEGEDPRGYFEGSGDKESFQEKEIEKSKTVTKPVKKEKEEKEEVDTVHYGAKDYEPKDPKDKGRWKRRRAYKKDLREHGMKRGKARQVALQSIPKRWGKHKGSF